MTQEKRRKKPVEISLIGEVDDWEDDAVKAILEVPPGSDCVFYMDSMGGSVYGAVAVATLLKLRKIHGTAIVLGECSSACLLLLAACEKRLVTRYSTLLFHRMRWQSDKRVESREAFQWARHFDELEKEIDRWQASMFGVGEAQVREWTEKGCYVTGTQMVEAGLAEMFEV